MKGCIILNTSSKLNKTVKIAVLSAIAGILMFLEFPIIPAFEWLKLDFSELPVLMGAFALGVVDITVASEMTLNYAHYYCYWFYYLLLQHRRCYCNFLVGEYYSLLDWYYCSLVIKEVTI